MSPEYVRIDCPEDEQDLTEYFRSVYDSELKAALDLDVRDRDERANVYRVDIDSVEKDAKGNVNVSYRVHWDAYYGCSDRNLVDVEYRDAFGELDEDGWLFEVYVPPEPRSTFEEF